ncbi:hypothetical protein QTO34_014008 [Cnephaeus nilssonii]|uniref:RING-type E3 ubiquitin transferase n=1 Tax=Cnephaeus nilssonii TaxID=3371016 RepID=A0AA40IA18_CNENI|nr:hypothetical protein QTO34_014008 [Eptesicus nilssonii]
MSFEGGHGSSWCRGAESGDAEPPPSPPPPPPPPPPPGEPTSVPSPSRYLPPLPAPPASPERPAKLDEPPAGVVPRRRGADELPPPPPLPPAGQEVSVAGDSGEGPRRLPEAAVPEAAVGKGSPGEPEAGAGGEGERQGAGDQSETRSVCSSRSSGGGGGGGDDQRAGHQHQHHQPICKICFQGAEQVGPGGSRGSRGGARARRVCLVSLATADLSAPRTALASRWHRCVAGRVPGLRGVYCVFAFPFLCRLMKMSRVSFDLHFFPSYLVLQLHIPQGELLNPCRCDGSVRYTHQLCLLKWISERGSWTCELCCYRYHVIAIKMKQPCQVFQGAPEQGSPRRRSPAHKADTSRRLVRMQRPRHLGKQSCPRLGSWLLTQTRTLQPLGTENCYHSFRKTNKNPDFPADFRESKSLSPSSQALIAP